MLAQLKTAFATHTQPRRAPVGLVLGTPKALKAWDGVEEPSLSELLDDPVMSRLMDRDNVQRDDLLTLVAQVRERLAAHA